MNKEIQSNTQNSRTNSKGIRTDDRRHPLMVAVFVIIAVIVCSTLAFSQQWHEFEPNTPARASEINDNFKIGAPQGSIIIWSGSLDSIPPGWVLCDGENGTPNLMNRFIVGAGDAYSPNDTGGSNSVTLTISQLPAHNHTITDPGHTHSYEKSYNPNGWTFWSDGTQSNNYTNQVVDTSSSTTGISINSSGGNSAHENRPPYYALAFIMRIYN